MTSHLAPIRHILWKHAIERPPEVVARQFAVHCRNNMIMTKGMVKIGFTAKRPTLRGVIAAKDIVADQTIIAVPDGAFITAFDVLRKAKQHAMDRTPTPVSFVPVFEATQVTNDNTAKLLSRRLGNTFVRAQDMLVALYLSHVILVDDPEKEPLVHFTDHLPRAEADFASLMSVLQRVLDHADPEWRDAVSMLASIHDITPQEARLLVSYALSMVLSRCLPLEHESTVLRLARETDVATAILKRRGSSAPGSDESPTRSVQDTNSAAVSTELQQQARPPMGFRVNCLAPVIDLINHAGPKDANASIAVPMDAEGDSKDPFGFRFLLVRAQKNIAAGEEVTMTYGDGHMDAAAMRMVYGFEPTAEEIAPA